MIDTHSTGIAIVIGARGGIGRAIVDALTHRGTFSEVIGLHRSSEPPIDLMNEASIEMAAQWAAAKGVPIRLIIIATGILKGEGVSPEKSLRDLDSSVLARSLAINTIGPALIAKHFLPLLPREGRCVFAALSARVGSIGDNQLGGWYGYRASKAALNQIIRTAATEVKRTRPEAICLALHPGTVSTPLSAPFVKSGLDVQSPEQAAARLLSVIDATTPIENGAFLDHLGLPIPW
jgi:NAD(P)-dependent dehydrogenase (short-subunit alcohol dehydrogenase family)